MWCTLTASAGAVPVQLGTILPVPPKEKLRVVPLFGGVVDCAAENVKHATVDWSALKHTEPLVEPHWITPLEIGHPLDAQGAKIRAEARSDAGNLLQGV